MEHCQEMEVYLSLKLDGMLEPAEERALEEHLAQCPQCRRLERELSEIHTAFPELEEYEAPEGFAKGVMERVAALEHKPKVVPLFRRPQVRALMGVAACAVLCIGLYRGGAFARNAQGLESVSSPSESLDTATYQMDQETEAAAGAKQAGQPDTDQSGAPEPPAPEEENPEPEVAIRGNTAAESEGGETDQAAQPDATGDVAGVQPSQFQVSLQDGMSGYTVAGQEVSAILTLDRLPQGWEAVLGQTPQWLTDEAGRTCCIITAAQLQQVEELAQQEETISACVEGRAEGEQSCALVVLETP